MSFSAQHQGYTIKDPFTIVPCHLALNLVFRRQISGNTTMSRVLDDIIMEDVAKACPESFLGFNKCMQSPEVRDKRDCIKFQVALQKCVREDVKSFQRIQKNCTEMISKYEHCLQNNSTNYSSKCFDEFKQVRLCAAKQVGGDVKLEEDRKNQ